MVSRTARWITLSSLSAWRRFATSGSTLYAGAKNPPKTPPRPTPPTPSPQSVRPTGKARCGAHCFPPPSPTLPAATDASPGSCRPEHSVLRLSVHSRAETPAIQLKAPTAAAVRAQGDEGKETVPAKKPRVVWSDELHQKFVDAVDKLGIDGACPVAPCLVSRALQVDATRVKGLIAGRSPSAPVYVVCCVALSGSDRVYCAEATPKEILELMGVPGLTRDTIKSHLQKYRLKLTQGGAQGLPMGATGQVE